MYVVPLGLSLQVWPKAARNREQASFEQGKTACFEQVMLPIAEQYSRDELAKDALKATKNEKLTRFMAAIGRTKDKKAAKGESSARKRPAAAVFIKPAAGAADSKKAAAAAPPLEEEEEEEVEEEEKKAAAAAVSVEGEGGEEEEEEEQQETGEETQEPTAKLLDKHVCFGGLGGHFYTHGNSLLYTCSLAVLSISTHNNALQGTDVDSVLGDPIPSFMEADKIPVFGPMFV